MAIRALSLFLALLLVACAEEVPAREPDISGTITLTGAGTILVEEKPEERGGGSAKASVRIVDATTVWWAAPAGRQKTSPAELTEGRRVRVWFDGPVATSYPVQATAKVIVLVSR